MTGPKRVTAKQLAANRANAQHSTGPRTPGGIAVSRYNALQHGILAKAVIPEALDPYESRQAFQELLATLRDEFAPANSVEELLVEGIATAYWRLARVYRAEAAAIAQAQDAIRRMRENLSPLDLLDSFGRTPPPDALKQRLQRLEACKNNKTRLRKAVVDEDPSMAEASDDQVAAAAEQEMTDLDRQIDERDRREAAHRQAVDSAAHSLPDMDQALKFVRYETALQNQLDRALSRLERLQRLRGGEFVPPPLRIDVAGDDSAAILGDIKAPDDIRGFDDGV